MAAAAAEKGSGRHAAAGQVELVPNSYVAFGLRLGRDEVTAWILGTAATIAAGELLALLSLHGSVPCASTSNGGTVRT